MKIFKAGYKALTKIDGNMLSQIENVARTCYKSEDKAADGSAMRMVASLIKNQHLAMLEHVSFSVKFVCDRGVSHELVRHRLASFAQESTRYCNYSKEKFGNEIAVIQPIFFPVESKAYAYWHKAMLEAEDRYFMLLAEGASPQEARSVLPNSLKTEIVVTMNLREWRHFFMLRAAGTSGKPHPQMLEITVPLLNELKQLVPIIFDDIMPLEL